MATQAAKKWAALHFFVQICLFLLAGCTHQVPRVEPSGFLGDYSRLKEGDHANLSYISQTADFSRYTKIQISPVELIAAKGTKLSKLDAEDRVRIRKMIETDLADELGKDYALVDAPGYDVMRLRVAVTEVKPSKPIRNMISSVLPIGLALSTLKRMVFGTHLSVGEASIEAEVVDSMTGERLAAAVDRRAGRKWGAGNFSSWGDVDAAFEYWAEVLRERLEELRETGPAR